MKRGIPKLPELPDITDPDVQWAFKEPLVPSNLSLASLFKVVQPPAPASAVAALAEACGGTLPEDYLAFLKESDGAENYDAATGAQRLGLWGVAEVLSRNVACGTGGVAPEMLLIGVDGSGGYVGLNRLNTAPPLDWPVVWIRPDAALPSQPSVIAPSFGEWRRRSFELRPGGFCCLAGSGYKGS